MCENNSVVKKLSEIISETVGIVDLDYSLFLSYHEGQVSLLQTNPCGSSLISARINNVPKASWPFEKVQQSANYTLGTNAYEIGKLQIYIVVQHIFFKQKKTTPTIQILL